MSVHTDKILSAAAETFKNRAPIYGRNWNKIGAALASYFPDGITLQSPSDFTRFYYIVIKVAKMSRYANNFHKGGHKDSIHDDVVYGAMLEAFDDEIQIQNQSAQAGEKKPHVARVERRRRRKD